MERLIKFAATWWRFALILVTVAGGAFLLGQCDGRSTERARNDAARAAANEALLKAQNAAQEQAAIERLTDAQTITEKQEELLDAIAEVPDEKPDAVRVALGCQRLRNQGVDTSGLPECR